MDYLVGQVSATAKNVLQPEIALISTIKTLSDLGNKSVLHQKYITEGLSMGQIAELLGVTKSAVSKSLKKLKIQLRPPNRRHLGRLSNPCFGYHVSKGKLVENRKEQRIIKEVIRLFQVEKLPLNTIAKRLTQAKVPTKNGKPLWRHDRIKDILKREGLLK
jgi:DNA-binding transcriptional ArsR family regulator